MAYIKNWEPGTTGPNTDRYVRLRRLDRRTNFISPMLSIWEGQIGTVEGMEEKRKTAERESALVRRFFYRARTDEDFLLATMDELADALSRLEHGAPKYLALLRKVQSELYQPLSAKAARAYKTELLEFADASGIQRTHPVVVASLALLFGSKPAHDVIYPKLKISDPEKHAYNALADLMTVSRLSMFHAMGNGPGRSGLELRFELFTFDEGLQQLVELLNPQYQLSQTIGETSHATTVRVQRALFPKLDERGFIELGQELGGTYSA